MLTEPDIAVAFFRMFGLIALIQACGSALFRSYANELSNADPIVRRTTFIAAIIGMLCVLAEHILGPARMIGSFAGLTDASLHAVLLESDAGTSRAVRLAGLVLVSLATLARRSSRQWLGTFGAFAALGSLALMGHVATDEQHFVLRALLLVHVSIAAWWLGALGAFWIATTREPIATLTTLILDFSRNAAWIVPIILVAGILMAILLVPNLAALGTPYGGLLLAKLGGFLLLMSFASWNKFRLGPAIARGEARAVTSFRRIVAIEWIIIAIVLAMTAVMTGFFGPE